MILFGILVPWVTAITSSLIDCWCVSSGALDWRHRTHPLPGFRQTTKQGLRRRRGWAGNTMTLWLAGWWFDSELKNCPSQMKKWNVEVVGGRWRHLAPKERLFSYWTPFNTSKRLRRLVWLKTVKVLWYTFRTASRRCPHARVVVVLCPRPMPARCTRPRPSRHVMMIGEEERAALWNQFGSARRSRLL